MGDESADTRPRYQAPEVVDLVHTARGTGACVGGASQVILPACQDGANPGAACTIGSLGATGTTCSRGHWATISCTKGPAHGPA